MRKVKGWAGFLVLAACSCGTDPRPSVLLVVLDTVSARSVGYCGYERNTTPVLDSLAESGAAFTAAQAVSPWTLPSGASVFTGLLPRSHGARRYADGRVMGAGLELPTLARVLKAEGYQTAGFVNNYLLGEEFGWHVGYDTFHSEYMGHNNAGPTVDLVLAWMEREAEPPFFLMVHFFDPHDPYTPPAPFDTLFGEGGPPHNWNTRETGDPPDPSLREHLLGLHDGEIAHVDQQTGRLLEGLREHRFAEETVVIIVADHGEEFLERGHIWHGKSLHQEVLHVPLVLAGPGVPVGEFHEEVSQVDIVPTVMDLLDMPWPGPLDGRNLFEARNRPQPVFSSNLNAGPQWPVAVLMDEKKVIWETTTDTWTAYDLEEDPDRTNPIPPDPELMEAAMDYWALPLKYAPLPVHRSRIDAILRDLGYI